MIVECPKEGYVVLVAGHYVSLGRDTKGRLLAIITKGHPNAGDKHVEVCSVHLAKDRKDAAEWFSKSLTEQPWIERQ